MATIIEMRDRQIVADYNHLDIGLCHIQSARVVPLDRLTKECTRCLRGGPGDVLVVTSRVDTVIVRPLVAGCHEDYRYLHIKGEYTQVYLSLEQLNRALRAQGLQIVPVNGRRESEGD